MNQTRREFVKTAALTSAVAMGAPAILRGQNLNDKIRMGFIGVGNRGSQLLHTFMANPDVDVAGLCDVYEPFLQRDRSLVDQRILDSTGNQVPQMGEVFPKEPARYKDFRRLLENPDIDAVCIATPDHWHAIQTIMACQAGKDVYVEKPLTITVHEGRRMVQVAEETKRVVAVGLNRRGSVVYHKVAKDVQNGKIGRVSIALAERVSNMFPAGIGKFPPADPPAGFDWDMWLGPRAKRPFQFNIAPYKFRWWSDYSSQMGNWGVHYMDVIRWMLNEKAPVAVSAFGSRNFVDDDADIPDIMEVLFEYPSGAIVKFSINEASSGGSIQWGEVELHGTTANLFVRENGYRLTEARPGQFQTWTAPVPAEEKTAGDLLGDPQKRDDSVANLVRNFLDCIKSRQTPWCPLEEGHRSTTLAHIANIALARKKRLEWDAETEQFTNDAQANEMLFYQYREPWTLG